MSIIGDDDKILERLGSCYWEGRNWSVHERLTEIFQILETKVNFDAYARDVGSCSQENRNFSMHDRLSMIFKLLETKPNYDTFARDIGPCHQNGRELSLHERMGHLLGNQADDRRSFKSILDKQDAMDSRLAAVEKALNGLMPLANGVLDFDGLKQMTQQYCQSVEAQAAELKETLVKLTAEEDGLVKLMPHIEQKLAECAEREKALADREIELMNREIQEKEQQPAEMRNLLSRLEKSKEIEKKQKRELDELKNEYNKQSQKLNQLNSLIRNIQTYCQNNGFDIPDKIIKNNSKYNN